MSDEKLNGGTEEKLPEENKEEVNLPKPKNTEISKPQIKPAEQSDIRTINSYDHGFGNGVLRIDERDFEEWVEETELKKLANIRLNNVREKMNKAEQDYAENFDKHLHLHSIIHTSTNEIEENTRQINQTNVKVAEVKEILPIAEEQKEFVKPAYNWIAVALFFLAGAAFMLADFSILFDVAFNTMGMERGEANMFAIGLVCIAFIIKPAVDRVFEKPYLKNNEVKRNHTFLIVVSLIALVALACMGYYRHYGFSATENKKNIDSKIAAIENSAESDTPENVKSLQEYMKEKELVNKEMSDSKALMLVYILSSILFALAGAICFSIAFPAVDSLLLRQRYRKEYHGQKEHLSQLEELINQFFRRIKEHKIEIEKANTEISFLPTLADLKERLLDLEEEEQKELINYFAKQIAAHHAMYRDGREKGRQYAITGQLLISPGATAEKMYPNRKYSSKRNGKTGDGKGKNGKVIRRNGYLHERLREELGHNFGNLKSELNDINGHA